MLTVPHDLQGYSTLLSFTFRMLLFMAEEQNNDIDIDNIMISIS